uniref:Protein root UVB sensitive 4 n=1 Tax=Ananas comosus var. bracteatus TaxID=296719 RepID=A0A6V7Q507_ANACO|nr:unnamed protein product [Ananas comosus var. bracteatus]
MQFASQIDLQSQLAIFPWDHRRKTLNSHSILDKSFVRNLNSKSSPKAPIFPDFSRVSCRFKLGDAERCGGWDAVRFPVVVQGSGKALRYVWDGAQLRMVRLDRENVDHFDGFHKAFEGFVEAVRDVFIPRQVQENYMIYLKWKLIHRVFSSSLQVLATQAMFRAMGVGSARSLPSAAALNWVLKDGLGRLSRCIYTASLGSAFDTNLKLEYWGGIVDACIPQYFLLLATAANIGKSISLAAYLATSSAIHRSFAIGDNLGEVSAKSQIQTVCFDNFGLLLAALLNLLCKSNQSFQAGLPLAVYPIFATVDLFAIYNGLKSVHLQTLTKNRLEIIIDTWICSGCIPSPAEVSSKEGIDVFRQRGGKLWSIRIGCLDPKNSSSMVSVATLKSLRSEDLYFICMGESYEGLRRKQEIVLCLRETAATSDIIVGLFQACFIRKTLLERKISWSCFSKGNINEDPRLVEWFHIVEESQAHAHKHIEQFSAELRAAGWAANNVLLSSKEQIRYSLLSDDLKQRR